MSLAEELQLPKKSLKEFKVVTTQILNYIPNVINEEKIYNNYVLCSSNIAGTRKQIRPFNKELFIRNSDDFSESFNQLANITDKLKKRKTNFTKDDFIIIDTPPQKSSILTLNALLTSNWYWYVLSAEDQWSLDARIVSDKIIQDVRKS